MAGLPVTSGRAEAGRAASSAPQGSAAAKEGTEFVGTLGIPLTCLPPTLHTTAQAHSIPTHSLTAKESIICPLNI